MNTEATRGLAYAPNFIITSQSPSTSLFTFPVSQAKEEFSNLTHLYIYKGLIYNTDNTHEIIYHPNLGNRYANGRSWYSVRHLNVYNRRVWTCWLLCHTSHFHFTSICFPISFPFPSLPFPCFSYLQFPCFPSFPPPFPFPVSLLFPFPVSHLFLFPCFPSSQYRGVEIKNKWIRNNTKLHGL